MYVGWQAVRFVKRADPDEVHVWPGARVVAPNRDSTFGTTRDLLALATLGGGINDLGLAREQSDTIGLDHRV